MPDLVGRDAERAAIGRFRDRTAGGRWTVAIVGAAGIGKTTLWRAVLADRTPDTCVLAARASSSETPLAYATLTDLLAEVPGEVVADLPVPQRHAVDVVTLRAAAGPEQVDVRAVGTALAGILTRLGESSPVLVAVDDLQWVDVASLAALDFAVRRVGAPRLGLLVAVRSEPDQVGDPLAGAAEAARLERHLEVLGPLTVGALHHVVRDHLGHALPRPVLLRVAETAGGNPLFALELARALDRTGQRVEAGQPLPVPDTLRRLTSDRVEALSPDGRRAALLVAVDPQPTVARVRELGAEAGLRVAEDAGVLVLRPGRVEFAHPLLAAAAAGLATPGERRAAHAELAAVTVDPELLARHLALATVGADEQVATALDAAVGATRGRGATGAAAELARLAVDHSPAGSPEALRRLATLADLLFETGDTGAAETAYRTVLANSPDPRRRAEAALQLADMVYETGATLACDVLYRRGLTEARGIDAESTARALLSLSVLHGGPDALERTAEARRLLEHATDPDPGLLAWAMLQDATNRFHAGAPLDVVTLDRALASERTGREWTAADQVAISRPVLLRFVDRYAEARDALLELRQRAAEDGNEGQLPYIVGHLPVVLLRLGDPDGARQAAEEHRDLAEASGQDAQLVQAHFNLALIALHEGRVADARQAAADMAQLNEVVREPQFRRGECGVLGSAALLAGEPAAALEPLREWWAITQRRAEAIGVSRFHPELVQAELAAGQRDRARAVVEHVEAAAERGDVPSLRAAMARCRALLLADEGDAAAALTTAEHAERLARAAAVPAELAHCLLVLGRLRRRARHKSLARESLTEAAAMFAAIGAPTWAAQARAELARVNVRAPAPLELTATERRVAELAARGHTNREIAATAFVSTKTVEANLARVYRKLGIRSRAELGARMGGGPVQG